MQWAETGMPGIVVPDKVGFGTRLMVRVVENCVRIFHPTWMVCTFELNLEPNHTSVC
jgi:hypothetical protein